MRRVLRYLTRHYLSIDARTLALTRVLLAALLLLDLIKRWRVLSIWYGDDGLLPVGAAFAAPWRRWQFSIFYALPHTAEARVGFVLCALAYVGLLAGYRTRLSQVASLIAVISLHTRVDLLANGGDFVLCILCWWTLFLPLGRRFSVDALRTDAPPDPTPVVSLAVLAATLQLAVIYFFNAVHKDGVTWMRGLSVYYVLHQERIIGPFGWWAREHLPLAATKALTYGTLAVEGVLPVLILSPVGKPWTRRLAVLLVWTLHLGIQTFANFGLFSPVMCVFSTLLVTTQDWDAIVRLGRARVGRARRAYYDASCGICSHFARLVARMDVFGRVTFVPNDDRAVPGIAPATFDDTIVTVDPATGRTWTRAVAIGEIIGALPLARPIAWLVRVPGLRAALDLAYDGVARRRTALSRWLGLGACGVARAAASADVRAPARGARLAVVTRELAVALLMVVAGAQVLVENRAVPAALKPEMPEVLAAAVSYTRLQEGWSMFAPEAPTSDMSLVVDAVTVDGRHVDPLNELAARVSDPLSRSVPIYPDYDVYWVDYIGRIAASAGFHEALRSWLLRYPERTGRSRDRILSFEAYVVEEDSPAPGQSASTNPRARLFLRYR